MSEPIGVHPLDAPHPVDLIDKHGAQYPELENEYGTGPGQLLVDARDTIAAGPHTDKGARMIDRINAFLSGNARA